MNKSQIVRSIRASWDICNTLKLTETVSTYQPLAVNPKVRDALLKGDASFVEIYLLTLSQSHYNFILYDYSVFQFSWGENSGSRFAFWPNPFSPDDAEIRDLQESLAEGGIDFEEYSQNLRDHEPDMRVPALRYEYAPDQYKEHLHPCSHFHFGHHSDNRWAAARQLSPLAFTLLVIKQFYGSFWKPEALEDSRLTLEERLIRERSSLRLIEQERFTERERQSFHIA